MLLAVSVTTIMIRSFLLLLAGVVSTLAFAPISSPIVQQSVPLSSALFVGKPRFDKTKQRWYPASPEEGAESAYDALGSLLRQGPKAYFSRILNPNEYEQVRGLMVMHVAVVVWWMHMCVSVTFSSNHCISLNVYHRLV